MHIELSDDARDKIINEAYDVNFGARPIKRYVQRNIESIIAKAIIMDELQVNSTIRIDVLNDKFIIK